MPVKTKQIKTFEEACEKLGLDPANLPDFSMMPEKHQKALLAHVKLVIIAQALNDGWEPNWNDYNEYKYTPWFEIKASRTKPGGSGFSDVHYDCWDSSSDVGSRLCFRSGDLAKYAGTQFKKLYQDYFLIS